MIQLMIINLDELNIKYDGSEFGTYLNAIANTINKRLSTIRNLSIRGISMNAWNGEIKTIVINYYPSKHHKYDMNGPAPYPQIYLSPLTGIKDAESHINSMLMAFQNTGRYVNYVKVFGESSAMPGYCSIIHSPISEGSYIER